MSPDSADIDGDGWDEPPADQTEAERRAQEEKFWQPADGVVVVYRAPRPGEPGGPPLAPAPSVMPAPGGRPSVTPQHPLRGLDLAQHPHRLGWCLTCHAPAYDCAASIEAVSLALADAGAATHSGLLVSLRVPPPTAAQLAVPGGEPADDLHVTLCYCGDVTELGEMGIAQALQVVQQGAATQAPLVGRTGRPDRFDASPQSDGLDPCFVHVEVPGLVAFREALAAALRRVGVPPRGDFAYTPHVTIAYVDPGALSPVGEAATHVPLAFDAVTVSAGPARTTVPLEGS